VCGVVRPSFTRAVLLRSYRFALRPQVIRLRSPDEVGTHVVVQGGTFLNDAVLRAMEV